MQTKKITQGFTLVELLVVIGILGVLLAITLVAINPSRQFKMANDTKRQSDINNIVNAIAQLRVDNKGSFPTTVGSSNTALTTNINPGAAGALPTTLPATAAASNFKKAASSANPGAVTSADKFDVLCLLLTGTQFTGATYTTPPYSYIGSLPADPADGKLFTNAGQTTSNAITQLTSTSCSDANGWDLGYSIAQDANGRITVAAKSDLGITQTATRTVWDLTSTR